MSCVRRCHCTTSFVCLTIVHRDRFTKVATISMALAAQRTHRVGLSALAIVSLATTRIWSRDLARCCERASERASKVSSIVAKIRNESCVIFQRPSPSQCVFFALMIAGRLRPPLADCLLARVHCGCAVAPSTAAKIRAHCGRHDSSAGELSAARRRRRRHRIVRRIHYITMRFDPI